MRRMRLIRCLKGYTLADVGERVGYSGDYLKAFGRKERDLNISAKKKIASMLGVTVEEIEGQISKEEREKYFCSNGRFKGFRKIQAERKKLQVEEVKKNKVEIIKACENQACPLNKNCYCDNDVVKEGRGDCAGQNLVKPKPISLVWSGTY